MKKMFTSKTITEIAIFAALGYVLDLFQGIWFKGLFPNGGSIGFAMIPVFFITYRRGFLPGLLTGLLMGIISMMGNVYFISDKWYKVFLQIGLDYVLAYPFCSLAGLFNPIIHKNLSKKQLGFWIGLATLFGGLGKLLCHYLSGILFWPTDYWNVGGASIYSLLYNGSYVLPSTILAVIILIIIALKFPQLIFLKEAEKEEVNPDEN